MKWIWIVVVAASALWLATPAWAEKAIVVVVGTDVSQLPKGPLPILFAAMAKHPRHNLFVLRFWSSGPMSFSYSTVTYNQKSQILFLNSGDTRSGKSVMRYSMVSLDKLKRCYGWAKRYSFNSVANLDLLDSYGCLRKVLSSMTWYTSP